MSEDIPIGQIDKNILTDAIATSDSTLVDDPTALVDGPTLVGGSTTPIDSLKLKTNASAVPRISAKVSR